VIETPELTAGSDDEIDVERIRGAVAKNFEGVVKIDHRVRGLLEDKIFEIRFEVSEASARTCTSTQAHAQAPKHMHKRASARKSYPLCHARTRPVRLLLPLLTLRALQGYELEVLFSRRAAFFDRDAAHKGFAKKDVTDAEIERMMDSVRFAVSDEARDAYQF